MKVLRFKLHDVPEELLQRFISLRERIYRDDYYYYPEHERQLLGYYGQRPDYDVECVLVEDGTRGDVGRLVAGRTTHLPWPFFGLFECPDEPEPFALLMDAAAEKARELGFDELRGPVDLNPFDGWLFLVQTTSPERWPGDPYHRPFYPDLFRRAGWEVAAEALSGCLTADADRELAEVADRLVTKLAADGIRLVTREQLEAEELFPQIYRLVLESFSAETHGFVPVEEEVLTAKYRPLFEAQQDPCSMLTFYREGELIGYVFSFANFIEDLCNPDGHKPRPSEMMPAPPHLALKNVAISGKLFGGPIYKCMLALLAQRSLELYDQPMGWRRMDRRRRPLQKMVETGKVTHTYQLFRKRLRWPGGGS